ncbi:MAG: aminotransferase class III-fold pyridoxal phosphate-dependent enzyme, partial [Rhodospirillales bacterium]
AGAVRLARAFTGRDRIAACGYHGWQDWFIGSTSRNLGVPKVVRDMTLTFTYNDVDSLVKLFHDHPGEFAGVIMEPMNAVAPEPGFLEAVKELCREHGAVFILDEVITGFRFAKGGAQELFGVTPDLATFGKGLANGYPLSAVVGRADIMVLMEDVFFSFTMGGEALSLAAARATLDKISKEPVIERLNENGSRVADGLRRRIADHGVEHIFSVTGRPCWSFLNISDAGPYTQWDIRTYVLQEMFERRVLMLGTHTMSYAHTDDDVARLLSAYDEILPAVRDAVAAGTLHTKLRCKPLKPLFRIR